MFTITKKGNCVSLYIISAYQRFHRNALFSDSRGNLYTYIEPLCCIPQINIMIYVNFISKKKRNTKIGYRLVHPVILTLLLWLRAVRKSVVSPTALWNKTKHLSPRNLAVGIDMFRYYSFRPPYFWVSKLWISLLGCPLVYQKPDNTAVQQCQEEGHTGQNPENSPRQYHLGCLQCSYFYMRLLS